jgi:hypothetical protein
MALHSYHRAWIEEKQFWKNTFKFKIQLFVPTKNHAKQFVLIAQNISKLDDSQRKTLRGWIITYIEVGDVSRRLTHEAKASEVTRLALDLLILLWAGGVITGEVKVIKGSTRSGHHLLKLLLVVVSEPVLLLVIVLAVVVPPGVVVLVGGGVELLSLGQSTIKWVVSPHSKKPLVDLLLSLQNLCKTQNFLASRTISSLGMFSYCSSEAIVKEDKTNSKVDKPIVLVGLASWPPTRALVIKGLLVWEAS